jgi:fermentation-respiration switch protein FrsA (DUF1100 family)
LKLRLHIFGTFVFAVGVLLSGGCAGRLLYHPTQQVYQTPSDHRLNYEEVSFTSRDGTSLAGWFIPAIGEASGTVIHFHGNAQNMTSHFSFVSWLPRERFNLFVFDYRGYGQSEGTPSRRGVYEDSVAAIQYAASRDDVDASKLLIFGQSLGGANAIAAVARNSFEGIRAVVIDSTFYSYRSIVRDKLGDLPVVWLLKWPLSFVMIGNGYSPGPVVDRIAPVPLLLIHGTSDRIIPYHHGHWLFEEAKEPKQLWTVKKGGHTAALSSHRKLYCKKLADYFRKAVE